MDISNTINNFLSKNHMTAYELSKKTGLTTVAIFQLSRGISKDAKLSTFIKISLDEFK